MGLVSRGCGGPRGGTPTGGTAVATSTGKGSATMPASSVYLTQTSLFLYARVGTANLQLSVDVRSAALVMCYQPIFMMNCGRFFSQGVRTRLTSEQEHGTRTLLEHEQSHLGRHIWK